MRRILWTTLLFLWALALHPVWAGPLPGQANPVVAEFTSNPTTVTVDVVDTSAAGVGTQVGNDLATEQIDFDSADSAFWRYDLSGVTGYPTDCTAKTYLVMFVPDSADCSDAASPSLCATVQVDVGGTSCALSTDSGDFVYTSVVISGQGISSSVLSFYSRRGILPVKWRKHLTASDLDYTSPDSTVWEVYFYTDTGSAPRVLCTVWTTTDPASALPSYAHCGT